RTVGLLFGLARAPAYQREADAGAGEAARRVPGTAGGFMGSAFHLGPAGPRLIEGTTNAGGPLLTGLHTPARCDPPQPPCRGPELRPAGAIGDRIARMLAAELRAARGSAAVLRSLAIADENPRAQFLYPEFELAAALLRRKGVAVEIRDTAELDPRAVDLVYL